METFISCALCVILSICVLQCITRELYNPDPLSTKLTAMPYPRKSMVPYRTHIIVIKIVRWVIVIGRSNEAQISSEEALVFFARIQHWG